MAECVGAEGGKSEGTWCDGLLEGANEGDSDVIRPSNSKRVGDNVVIVGVSEAITEGGTDGRSDGESDRRREGAVEGINDGASDGIMEG